MGIKKTDVPFLDVNFWWKLDGRLDRIIITSQLGTVNTHDLKAFPQQE